MTHSLPGMPAPGASFEVPLAMLSACHGRVEQQCDTLRRLLAHLAAQGADRAAREAAAAVRRYFDTAAAHHHADEEQDLFPALLEAVAGSDAVCLRALTDGLRAEHRQLEARWQRLRVPLGTLAEGGEAALDAAQVQAFTQAYAGHIAREEAELLPLARRLLDDAQLDVLGRAMRQRRGVALPD
jgi:hemerythrin-like domain-containing protein